MSEDTLTALQAADARVRRLEAMQLQAIEGNPLDDVQVAMFEMFEREGWAHERCTAYLLQLARRSAEPHAAE